MLKRLVYISFITVTILSVCVNPVETATTWETTTSSGNALDWTVDQGATNIHINNIPDLRSTYQAVNPAETTGTVLDLSATALTTGNGLKITVNTDTIQDSAKIISVMRGATELFALGPWGGITSSGVSALYSTYYDGGNFFFGTSGGPTRIGSDLDRDIELYPQGTGKVYIRGTAKIGDANTTIAKDGSNNLSFTDAVTGTKTLAELAAVHDAVTLSTDLGNNLLGLSTQQITLDTQTAATVFAGPATGDPAAPTFRALASTDIPALAYESSTSNDLIPTESMGILETTTYLQLEY